MLKSVIMKINPKFKIREIAGEILIVNQGIANVNMTRIISLNKSAKLLFETLFGKEFNVEDAAQVLVERYRIDMERALADAGRWIDLMKECGAICL